MDKTKTNLRELALELSDGYTTTTIYASSRAALREELESDTSPASHGIELDEDEDEYTVDYRILCESDGCDMGGECACSVFSVTVS